MNKLKFLLILMAVNWTVNFGYAQVGINTTNPLSTLDINGNLSVKVITLTGGSSASPTPISDGVYLSLDPRNGTTDNYILPLPSSVPGRVYILRNITDFDTAQLSISGGTQRFFPKNSSSGTFTIAMPPNSDNKSLILISDGFNWTYFN
ncbi:hypothetical protein ACSVH2_02945 [Flavobacterium sp. RSB2_4_14]|uniref:hypothetical protein n=1 Tax=Flavobacterium sp. RSB2_4_14 TaxID=3447665 RepID=UPI003F38FE9F